PWVTNSGLGIIGSSNLPDKRNLNGARGIDALTGGSNFDISEWMLRKCIESMTTRKGMIAVLCKTSVARKLLSYIWEKSFPITSASIYEIDAQKYFQAAVHACLFVLETGLGPIARECSHYDSLTAAVSSNRIGFHDNRLLADIDAYER